MKGPRSYTSPIFVLPSITISYLLLNIVKINQHKARHDNCYNLKFKALGFAFSIRLFQKPQTQF